MARTGRWEGDALWTDGRGREKARRLDLLLLAGLRILALRRLIL